MKICKSCGADLPLEAFQRRRVDNPELYARCRDCRTTRQAEYYQENREHITKRTRAYASRPGVLELRRARQRERYRDARLGALVAYEGKCSCCGEDRAEFLAIDHINGGGREHTKHIRFYEWLQKAGYPKDAFRLLCHNCNFSRGIYGYCPHDLEKEATA